MREILFRGKDIDNGIFVTGYLIGNDTGKKYITLVGSHCKEVIPETVGQCTGLKDKNGKLIFEGDIVRDEQSGYNYFIKWFSEYACFSLANKSGHMEFGCDELEIFLDDLVVVDNIHDNPESLKGE